MDLLFEIGCEELPASFQKPALSFLEAEMNKALDDTRLNGEGEAQRATFATYATPRRLALLVSAIPARAPDVKRKLQGPPVKAAFAPDGKPTKAGEGFARKAGVPVEQLRTEGDRVVVEQEIKGQTAAEALPPILEKLIRGIPFKKSMRWDDLDHDAFARPVHWIVATLDGKPLEIRFADVVSGARTRGHRFHAPDWFEPKAKSYLESLRKAHVLADWAERKGRIWEEVRRAAKEASGEPLPDDDLLETVTGLVEEPSGVQGSFDAAFLELPPEVLVSEMKGHQKYFAVRDPSSKQLLPAFVAVSNTRVKDPALSRKGYERVLRSRLSDGKFFFDEDLKLPLGQRRGKLEKTVFVQGLGTQWQRVQRIHALAQWLHGATGRGEIAAMMQAAELAKCDLATGMVGEFPELQGVMGRVYATRQGAPQAVADAILEHYLPRGAEDRLPEHDEGALLGIADRLDQLAGIFGLGKEPTGTADPYALRRSAIGILRIVLEKGYRFDFAEALAFAHQTHVAAGSKIQDASEKIWKFLEGRLDAHWRGLAAPDSIQAVLQTGSKDLVSLEQRLRALEEVRRKNPAHFEATAAAFKRIANILNQAREKRLAPIAFDKELLAEPSEKALAEGLLRGRTRVQTAVADQEDYLAAYGVLAELRPAVDRFFDEVMVMDPEARKRDNRLALLRLLSELFAPLADFARLQIEKSA